ncbi:Serine protease htra2, mitochondrial [Orobanche minor]
MDQNTANSVYQDPWHLEPCRYNPYLFSNNILDFEMKDIGLRACGGSVVSICVRLEDGADTIDRSGFVVDSTLVDGEYSNTILTSACIVRHNKFADGVALPSPSDIEITVIFAEGTTCLGELVGYDFHYSIAALKVRTPMPIPSLRLKKLDDSISLDPNFIDQPDHPGDRFRLFPGDAVIALGRYSQGFMIVLGKFSITRTGFQCENLLRAECVINTHGIGGPLINRRGEVIGINFFHNDFTPFLPINIVILWWENVKKNGYCVIPRHGLKLRNLYVYPPGYLEHVMQTFPNTFTGVVVDKVKSSTASSTEILKKDVIIECDGKPVSSTLEFLELIWDKAGEPVQLTLLRPHDGSRLHLTITVANVGLKHLNRWPLPILRTSCR